VIGVDADERGTFEIRDITPGIYSLVAQRDGFLDNSTCLRDGLRMPPRFSIGKSQTIGNVTFRMRPWAVLTGKIKFEDGEPAIGVRVELYRQYRLRARQGFTVVQAGVTDEHGEYRIHGIGPGSYFVAAVYEKAAPTPTLQDQARVDAAGSEIPLTTYATTFYPDTLKLSEAVSVRLDYGREIGGIDLSLRPVRKVKLKGQIVDGVTGAVIDTAAIVLERVDADRVGTLPIPAHTEFDRITNDFTIPDVTPGSYEVWVDATDEGKRLTGAQLLNVSEQDVDNLNLIVMPAVKWSGTIRAEGVGRTTGAGSLKVTLEPRSERGAIVDASPTETPTGTSFPVALVPTETYDVFIQNLAPDFYVSAVRVNGSDVRASGLAGSMASNIPFEIVVDSRGGRISGRVFGPDNDVWSGANMALIPDPPRDRLQSYREAAGDEFGDFQIRGIPPGKYTLGLARRSSLRCLRSRRPGRLPSRRYGGHSATVQPAILRLQREVDGPSVSACVI